MGTAKRERQKTNRELKRAEEVKLEQRSRVKRRAVRIGIILVLIVGGVVAIALIAGGGGDSEDAATDTTVATGDTTDATTASDEEAEFAYGEGECAPDTKPEGDDRARPTTDGGFAFDDAPQQCIDPDADYTATFETSEGAVTVDLHTDDTPGTVNNFVTLANWGYYDDTVVFRGDHGLGIIQGGGMSNTDNPGYTIPDEGGSYTYEAGQLVMARTAAPDSGGAQWFFNANDDASALDAQGTYVVFGTVTEGLDVVGEILDLFPPGDDMNPEHEVVLESVTITES